MATSKTKFYAVRRGRETGIFQSWAECSASVMGFAGAIYKSFATRTEAEAFLAGENHLAPAEKKAIASRKNNKTALQNDTDNAADIAADYIIYTDGSCLVNPGGAGGWAAVIVERATGEVTEISGGEAVTTNNRMELTAAIRALSAAATGARVALFTDTSI